MWRPISLLLLAACSVHGTDIEAGRRLYRTGDVLSGLNLQVAVSGDVTVTGRRWRCASCHGRSGMGGIEGGILVPPITANALFHSTGLLSRFSSFLEGRQTPQLLAAVRSPRLHPPYNKETLARAVREGRDSAGQTLDTAMPRYRLSDADLANLCDYLESLGAQPSPGFDDAVIHFGTVITEGIVPADQTSLLSMLRASFDQKNREAASQQTKLSRVARDKEEFYRDSRHWTLHVWELKGPPETWTRQLLQLYQRQPVFAMIGGLADGPWQPIADFCDRFEIPCLFPETVLPAKRPEHGYTVYFSPGIRGEANVLAAHLRQSGIAPARVLQIYRDTFPARAAAEALRAALPGIVEQKLPPGSAPAAGYWRTLIGQKRPLKLVVWGGAADLQNLECASTPVPVYLSATLLNGLKRMLGCHSIYLTYPYSVTDTGGEERVRMKNWQLSKGVPAGNERIQLNAQFAVALVDYSITHMRGIFSRDYLVETIERETENAPHPGVFPRLGLSAGQRYASKGAYIVRPILNFPGVQAVSDWIVP